MTALAWVVLLGSRARSEPSRCRSGFAALGARCCAPGQGLSGENCVGQPNSCPSPYLRVDTPVPGCILPAQKVRIQGGSVTLGPNDWDSVNILERHTVTAKTFWIDRGEVDEFRYQQCVQASLCNPRSVAKEPGLPIVGIERDEAAKYCAFVGGRLPTPAEWVFAATGSGGRRYPWGAHGLVCRRAAFGLTEGPCSEDGSGPELVGMRPAGASPDGVLDLAGNVAELTVAGDEVYLYGGSFRSILARDLKAWSFQRGVVDDAVGFRCVYDRDASASGTDN